MLNSVVVSVILIILILAIVDPGQRIRTKSEYGDRVYQIAWHIALPGYTTSASPEHKVALSKWVGTRYEPISVTIDGVQNPEATAAVALRIIGLYENYTLVREGGHLVLHKPATETREFTWRAWYRVSPWRDVTS
jgi:hypothetical protein